MPHWRNGRGRSVAPIEHLSADRLGDMVNAERSNPPDLATLTRPHDDLLAPPPVEYFAPPTTPAYDYPDTPPAPPPVEPDYTWDDSVPPAAPPIEDLPLEDLTAANIPAEAPEIYPPAYEVPAVPEQAPKSRVAKKKRGGRHREPASLRHFGRGLSRALRSALVTPRVVAMVGVIGLLVVATVVLGVS